MNFNRLLEEQELLQKKKVISSGRNVYVKTRGQTMFICFLVVRGIICHEFVPLKPLQNQALWLQVLDCFLEQTHP